LKKARVRFTPEAASVISTLPPEIKKLVRASIDELLINPQSGGELTGELEGYRSLRQRDTVLFTAWATLKRQSKYC
jgi:mRNA-degrading endonuclease RelE of RelBE toxin-antitoxin system